MSTEYTDRNQSVLNKGKQDKFRTVIPSHDYPRTERYVLSLAANGAYRKFGDVHRAVTRQHQIIETHEQFEAWYRAFGCRALLFLICIPPPSCGKRVALAAGWRERKTRNSTH